MRVPTFCTKDALMDEEYTQNHRSIDENAITAVTWNGAKSYATTGFDKLSACLNYWSKAGTYARRKPEEVNTDMEKIFADDESVALAIIFGLRLITRKPTVKGIDETQTGYGRRDEFYKAIRWLAVSGVRQYEQMLYRNLHLIPVFGCWKDLITEPLVDALDRTKVYELVSRNLGDQLLRKYLPQIRSAKYARTDRDKKRIAWAKGLCKFLGISYGEYRKLKSSGTGHIFQKQMSRGDFESVHFNGIPGKAMLGFTSRKGKDNQTVFERHGQVERLREWVLGQKTIKFNGYPYELTRAASKNPSLIQGMIFDKQFEALLAPMREHNLGNVLCALDTSGSMSWGKMMGDVTPLEVCLSMGLVFSALNVGYFKDTVVAFSSHSHLVKLEGGFSERVQQVSGLNAMGSTNFQSVIDLLVKVRREHPEISLDQYPETLLVVSDMQFNPVGDNAQTNYEAAMEKLNSVGLNEMRIIWWFVNGAGTDFPAQMNDKGVYIIGGFDPVNLKALMGLSTTDTEKPKDFVAKEKVDETPISGMKNFLSQPIFGLINNDESISYDEVKVLEKEYAKAGEEV